MLRFETTAEFVVVPQHFQWPWIAFSEGRDAFAYPEGPRSFAIRRLAAIDAVTHVALPKAFALPTSASPASGTTARHPGVHAVALDPSGRSIALFAWRESQSLACVADDGGAREPVDLSAAHGANAGPQAAMFSRDGRAIWVSTESDERASIVRLDAVDLSVLGRVDFPCPPLPAAHELHLHPGEDAALLTMACGQDGTFARVARWVSGAVVGVPNEVETGIEPAGIAEFDPDGESVCFVGERGVELRRWPRLAREARVEMPSGLVNRYSGIRLGDRVVVAATDEEEEGTDRALVYDARTLKLLEDAPSPRGMWAGRVGADRLVSIVAAGKARHQGVVSILSL